MSAVTTLGMAIKDKTNKEVGLITCGPVIWVIALVYAINFYLVRFIKGSKVKSLIQCPDGKIRHCNRNKVDYIRQVEGYDFPRFKDVGYPASLWEEKHQRLLEANVRYTPKRVWKHFEPIDKKFLKSLE
jgi:hypothetical protein